MIAHADRFSPAFSKEATNGKYPKVSFADYEAHNYPAKDEWLYSSFWYKQFDAMAFKTMLRQLISKWGVMSIDLQTAFDNDREYVEPDDYIQAEAAELPEQAEAGAIELPEDAAQKEKRVSLSDV